MNIQRMKVCANCGSRIEHGYEVEFCQSCLLINRWRESLKAFFEEVYMPGSTLSRDQLQIALDIEKSVKTGKSIKIAVQKGRRVGASEVCACAGLWFIVQTEKKKAVGIFSFREDAAKQVFNKVRDAISNNAWLMSLIKSQGREDKLLEKSVTFVNGSKMYMDTGSEHAGRGYDLDWGHFTEAAFIAEKFFTAAMQAGLSGDSHIILESTPGKEAGTFHAACQTENSPYTRFFIPSFVLDQQGVELVLSGMHAHLIPQHFKEINAINATYDKIMDLITTMTVQEVRAEYMGEFVGGADLMFPSQLYDPLTVIKKEMLLEYGIYGSEGELSADYKHIEKQSKVLAKDSRKMFFEKQYTARMCSMAREEMNPVILRWKMLNERGTKNNRQPWSFVMGIDWGRKDWTVVVVFAVRKDDDFHQLVHVQSWNHVEYEDSYDRIKVIFEKWTDAGYVEVYSDITSMQDQALAALRQIGVNPVLGFFMSAKNKKMAANILFTMMQQRKIWFFKHAQLRTGIMSVNYDVKGADGHLNDFAAAVLIAINRVQLSKIVASDAKALSIDQMIFQVGKA